MPNVYQDSVILPEELAKFPLEDEQEMLEQTEHVDLSGEVRLDREVFTAWLHICQKTAGRCPCAAALMRYAIDQQGMELRGAVAGDTAWELCCRILGHPEDTKSLGSREIAQLLVYWFEERQLPAEMSDAIYQGMLEDLRERKKTIETHDDEQAMKSRWVRQLLHQELDLAREAWLSNAPDMPVDLDIEFELQEAAQLSMTAETEMEAANLIASVANEGDQNAGVQSSNSAADQTEWGDQYWEDEWYDDQSVWDDCEQGTSIANAQRQQLQRQLDELVAKQDYLGAATLKAEMDRKAEAEVAPDTSAEAERENDACPDRPLLDPPEFADRIKDTDREPHWIPGAFPTIFQNETGDPFNYVLKEVDLVTWGPHVLRSRGWHAQAHMTFMYWWMNMMQRYQALSAKKWYIRDNPDATGYTVDDLSNMSIGALAKQMVGYTANVPGTKASKARLRRLILAMVRQIEIETRTCEGTADKAQGARSLGDVPCVFGTLTSQRYHWDEVIRIIAKVEGIDDYKSLGKSKRRELVNKYPLFVSWYCAVRLELAVKAIVVPIFGASAYFCVFEWSPTGAMVHVHYVLWKPGAPRFDLRAQKLQDHAEALRKAGLIAAGHARCRIDDVVEFFNQYISEWNPNKNDEGEEAMSSVAERINTAEEHTASLSVEEMLRLLSDDMSDERHAYYNRLVRTEQMHDFHYPDPLGAPNPSQPCARLLKGTINMWYCGNGYPRDIVREPCDQSIAQDALRGDLWRCNLCRNCGLMNSHIPAVTVGTQSNSDAQPVSTKHQSETYCCKYCSKPKRRGTKSALFDVMDEMSRKDASAKDKFGDTFEQSKLGSKIHRAFMAEVGEEMCQGEVAHHANRCPEYFCSRPEKQVHLYKKALGLIKKKARASNEEAEDANAPEDQPLPKKLATSPSDLELYERRSLYKFPEGTNLSEHLPTRETPEEQVVAASAYEFFRLVHYHGGKNPHLTWHGPHEMPIVTISPVVKLREGADFTFGARWALMQYHAWVDRQQFLGMEENAVREYFRTWIEQPDCPWYIKDQYFSDNGGRLRGVGKDGGRKRGKADSAPQQVYEEKIQGFLKNQDYAAAAELQKQKQQLMELLKLEEYAAAAKLQAQMLNDEEEEQPLLVPSEDEEHKMEHESDTEDSNEDEPRANDDTHVLKMLYKGNLEEMNRSNEQTRKAKVVNRRHDFYKNTRCTSTAQEEQSALPAGVINVNEDSEDDEDYFGEQKEIAKEVQEIRAAQQWVNQEGWDAASEGRAMSRTGKEIDLRLDWTDVKMKLAKGVGPDDDANPVRVNENSVLRDYALDKLDPVQRAFADRVLAWAVELVAAYKKNKCHWQAPRHTYIAHMARWLGRQRQVHDP